MHSKRVLATLVFAIGFLNSLPAKGIPIPALNLRDLVRDADVIAVGQVTAVRELGRTNFDRGGQSIPGRRMLAFLSAHRIVKGHVSGPTISVKFILSETPLGYASIQGQQFGMFFLRKTPNQEYAILNPYYPCLVASTEAPVIKGNDFDRVVAEVAQVLVKSGSSVDERQRAIHALATVKTSSAMTALRAAANDIDVAVRLKAAAVLLRQNDMSVLGAVQDVLLNPPPGIDAGLLSNLAFAIRDSVKDQETIPILERLLRAPDVQTRRAAVAALRHTEAEAAVGPLSTALEDPDREVRYNAVLGLAVITGQSEWGPPINQFERDERRYLSFWREWIRTR